MVNTVDRIRRGQLDSRVEGQSNLQFFFNAQAGL
jgi:hypothetical protein